MISLYDLIEASNGQLFGEPAAQLFDDFCLDPANAGENLLFVAARTEFGDTHQYMAEAVENGVSGIICQVPPEFDTDGVSVILVKDTVAALLAWSHYVLGKFGTKVIGVAGTAGKSIAVDAIGRILQQKYPVHLAANSAYSRLSVPLALARLTPNHKFAVIKIGVRQPGEVASIVEAIQPEIGIVTHIGDVNTEYFDTPEKLMEEHAILIDYLSPTGLTILNYDEDAVRAIAPRSRAPVKTVGMMTFGADMMALNVVTDPGGTGFDLRYGNERFTDLHMPIYNQYHLYSIMAALVIGIHYGIPLATSLKTISDLQPLPGRMNPLAGLNGALLIDDTYSANPQSTLAALDWLNSVRNKSERVFFVFGDMENLGQFSQSGHRKVGRRVAEVADVLITQGSDAAVAARSALDYGMPSRNVHITYASHDVISILLNNYSLSKDDIILLKGGPTSRIEQVTKVLLKTPADSEKLVRQDIEWDQVSTSQSSRLTWVEINTNALANNIRRLKEMVGKDVTLMTVVKANGYGHGAVMTAQTALMNGAEYLAVSSIQEAVELRDAGILAPVLTLSYTPALMVRQAIHQNITLTLYDLGLARTYDRIARELGEKLRVHIKIDTGMGRLGTTPSEAILLFRHLVTMQNLDIEGVYTHFSTADENPEYVAKQLEVFKKIIRPVQATTGFKFRYIHAANSAATIAYSDTHFNLVRVGLATYGLHPSRAVPLPETFQPVMTWKTVIAQVKTLPPDHPVGYGNTYVTRQEERIAVLPVGYADGFRRAPHNWGEVLIHGQRAKIIGRVGMEKSVVRITDIPGVSIGDEVVLLGKQGNEIITAEDIGRRLGTINYEVTCSILPRVPR